MSHTIYLNTAEAKDCQDRGDTHGYIIQQNSQLHGENKELHARINELEKELADSEGDSDRQEKSLTYMRGLLHNLVEKDKLEKGLVEYVISESEYREKRVKLLESELLVFCRKAMGCYYGMFMFFYLVGICSVYSSIFCCIGGSVPYLVFESMMGIEKDIEKDKDRVKKEVTRRKKEISAVDDAQDLLNSYIDCI